MSKPVHGDVLLGKFFKDIFTPIESLTEDVCKNQDLFMLRWGIKVLKVALAKLEYHLSIKQDQVAGGRKGAKLAQESRGPDISTII